MYSQFSRNIVGRTIQLFVGILCVLFFTVSLPAQESHHHSTGLEFIENKNQWEPEVLYKLDLRAGAVFLERSCFTFMFQDAQAINNIVKYKHGPHGLTAGLNLPASTIKCHAYKVRFLNANENVNVLSEESNVGYYNFYIGNDQRKWASNVRSYGRVLYQNLYENTDMQIYENNYQLKYDLILHPGAKAGNIQFSYEGADKLYLDKGNLIVKTSVNTITELSPEAFQVIKGVKVPVACSFRLNGTILSFDFPDGYDHSETLIIDPVLVFSTYSGSTADNWGFTATFDSKGCAYSGGIAFGNGYPATTGAFQMSFGGGQNGYYLSGCDVAIIKYDSTGTQRLWATYLGGLKNDLPHSMIVDDQDDLMIYGTTGSANFPVTAGAFDLTFGGGTLVSYDFNSLGFESGVDIFVSKLKSDGTSLLASTYVGGSANDGLNYPSILSYNYGDGARGEIMTDSNNNVYVVSTTNSTDFPVTPGAFQTTPGGGGQDGVVFKMNPGLTAMLWSSYIGGSAADAVYGIVLDDNNDLYITGGTSSIDFPVTPGTLHTSYLGGSTDGFVAKISAGGNSILRSTYYGSDAYDQSYLIVRGPSGNIYLYGQTSKTGNFFIQNAAWSTPGGGQFVSKLQPDLASLVWSTAFGTGNGGPDISPNAFLVDDCRNIYMSGWGGLTINGFGGTSGLPLTQNAFQNTTDGEDFYFLVIDDNASSIVYASYFGSPSASDHVDGGTSRFDRQGVIYNAVCAGCGGYSNFPTTPGAWSNTNNSTNCNNAIVKFDFQLAGVMATAVAAPNDTGCAPFTVNFAGTGNGISFLWDFDDPASGANNTASVLSPAHTFNLPGTYHVTFITTDSTKCNISDTAYVTITVSAPFVVDLGKDSIICAGTTFPLDAGVPNADYHWSTGAGGQHIIANTTGTYWVSVERDGCTGADTIDLVFATGPIVDLGNDTVFCEAASLILDAGNPGNAYLWSTSDTTQTIAVNTPGDYWVSVSNDICPGVADSITINVEMAPVVDLGHDTLICGSVNMFLNAGNPGSKYYWSTHQITQAIVAQEPGIYWVSVTGQHCSTIDTIIISAIIKPEFGKSIKMCFRDQIVLDAGAQGGEYLWSTGEHSQAIVVTEPGTYWVEISGGKCRESDTVVINKGGSPTMYFPNAFTPNKDGLNEIFSGEGDEVEYFHMEIFNRWGELIFETDDYANTWDGTYKGNPVQSDLYVWIADYMTSCTNKLLKRNVGTVMLIR